MAGGRSPVFSFEFFPPRTLAAEEQMWEAVHRLAAAGPAYMTVTYGAGGSSRTWTTETAIRIFQETGIPTAAHLTCLGLDKMEIEMMARLLWRNRVHHIVALRGDPPKGEAPPPPDSEHYLYANELVEGLAGLAEFEISVAAYPEKHPEAPDLATDIAHLKRKCAAGATRAISQFFFDTDAFLRFRDLCAAAGIVVPIVPGMLPILGFEKARLLAARCGTRIPPELAARFEGLPQGSAAESAVAREFLDEQIATLRREGVEAFHFYTLNRAGPTMAAVEGLLPNMGDR